jgi:hypothetical protein
MEFDFDLRIKPCNNEESIKYSDLFIEDKYEIDRIVYILKTTEGHTIKIERNDKGNVKFTEKQRNVLIRIYNRIYYFCNPSNKTDNC